MTTSKNRSSQGHNTQRSNGQRTSSATSASEPTGLSSTARTMLVFGLAAAAFFGAYRFAQASNLTAAPGGGAAGYAQQAVATAPGAPGAGGAPAGGGGCCGGGGAPIEGAATVEGGIQKISVDLSSGGYNPNVIKLKANVPTEITFGQGGGCTAGVVSDDLGFSEDLTSGPKTVKLDGLAPGTYNFSCSMYMVTGQIVVE